MKTKHIKQSAPKITTLCVLGGHGIPVKVDGKWKWIGVYPGEEPLLLEHIQAAVLQAASRRHICLVFSGGESREAAGRRSEAEGYFEMAKEHSWFGHAEVEKRTLREPFARDSLENLIFSILLFFQTFGYWPTEIIVLGWIFKAERFHLHRQAVKWPAARFNYIGVNNPAPGNLYAALAGEQAKIEAVKRDLFLAGPEWAAQREMRDPFQRYHRYQKVHPAFDRIFELMDRNALIKEFDWNMVRQPEAPA
jgi:hypothetical protein